MKLALLLLLAPLGFAQPQNPNEGQRLFLIHCAPCHGQKGDGGRGASLAVERLPRAPDEEALVRVIREGIAGTEMPPSYLEDGQIRQIAVWVRGLRQTSSSKLTAGVQRGQQLYRSKGNCAQCHAIDGQGGVLGPDLSDIGARRNPAYLRRSLLEPEADIFENFNQYRWVIDLPDNFLQVRIVTRDGRKITAARLNEDAFSIQVRDQQGRVYSFDKRDLTELHKDWRKSPMPAYGGVFSPAEIDDVVAYLVSMRGTR